MEIVIKTHPLKARYKFDATFKMEAIRYWLGSGKSTVVVAKELGLGPAAGTQFWHSAGNWVSPRECLSLAL